MALENQHCIVLGLSCTGKSTAIKELWRLGYLAWDGDYVYREVRERFGQTTGEVRDRYALAAFVEHALNLKPYLDVLLWNGHPREVRRRMIEAGDHRPIRPIAFVVASEAYIRRNVAARNSAVVAGIDPWHHRPRNADEIIARQGHLVHICASDTYLINVDVDGPPLSLQIADWLETNPSHDEEVCP